PLSSRPISTGLRRLRRSRNSRQASGKPVRRMCQGGDRQIVRPMQIAPPAGVSTIITAGGRGLLLRTFTFYGIARIIAKLEFTWWALTFVGTLRLRSAMRYEADGPAQCGDYRPRRPRQDHPGRRPA